jgi:hypothetical protein
LILKRGGSLHHTFRTVAVRSVYIACISLPPPISGINFSRIRVKQLPYIRNYFKIVSDRDIFVAKV